jgi:5-methylcytosine-specific restriction endonuclease McrA
MKKKLTGYQKLLQDQRWKEMSQRIIERDGCCQKCLSKQSLEAHHLAYVYGRKPWEYPDEWLVALCYNCHKQETKDTAELLDSFLQIRVSGMWSKEIFKKFFKTINER